MKNVQWQHDIIIRNVAHTKTKNLKCHLPHLCRTQKLHSCTVCCRCCNCNSKTETDIRFYARLCMWRHARRQTPDGRRSLQVASQTLPRLLPIATHTHGCCNIFWVHKFLLHTFGALV